MTAPFTAWAFDGIPRDKWHEGEFHDLPPFHGSPPPRRCKPAAARHEAIRALIEAGHSPQEAAAQLGVGLATVYRAAPGVHRQSNEARDAQIRALYAEGKTTAQIVKSVGVGEGTARRVRREGK